MNSKDKPTTQHFHAGQRASHIVGTHHGKRFVLYSVRRSGWLIWWYTTVRYLGVQLVNGANAKFCLRSTTYEWALLKSIFRGRAFRTGDERFDERFILESSVPSRFATKVLGSASLRQHLLEVFTGLRRRCIELDGQWLVLEETPASYTLEGGPEETAYVRRAVELMVNLAEEIERIN